MGNFFSEAESRELIGRHNEDAPRYSVTWLVGQNRPIYLFGAGGTIGQAYSLLRDAKPRALLDNNPDLTGTSVCGLPVVAPADMWRQLREENALVVLGLTRTGNFHSVREQFLHQNVETVDWYDCWRLSTPGVDVRIVENNPDAAAALTVWDDWESRETYRGLVRFHVTHSAADLPFYSEHQYFIDAVPRRFYHSFADVGAFTGDTYEAFRQRFGDDFDNYYLYEPLAENSSRFPVGIRSDPRIETFPVALSDKPGTARLTAQGSETKFDPRGEVVVRQSTFDAENGERRVTFLKMDIEGMEPQALKGAEKTIRAQRPVLGICIYHQLEHLWSIPLWIHRLGCGYRLIARHHARTENEAVCYAIPD